MQAKLYKQASNSTYSQLKLGFLNTRKCLQDFCLQKKLNHATYIVYFEFSFAINLLVRAYNCLKLIDLLIFLTRFLFNIFNSNHKLSFFPKIGFLDFLINCLDKITYQNLICLLLVKKFHSNLLYCLTFPKFYQNRKTLPSFCAF